MSICSTGLSRTEKKGGRLGAREPLPEPFAVRTRVAAHLLSCGMTRLWQLIGAGELETFRDGRARRVVTASIRRYVANRIEAQHSEPRPCQPERAIAARIEKSRVRRADHNKPAE